MLNRRNLFAASAAAAVTSSPLAKAMAKADFKKPSSNTGRRPHLRLTTRPFCTTYPSSITGWNNLTMLLLTAVVLWG